jgi:drug/metabolite transporter (DMT)-like permease
MSARFERHPQLVGVGLAVIAAIAFGTLAISAKFAYRAGAHPFPLLAWRFALAAVMLALYHAVRRRSMRLPGRDLAKTLGAGGFLYGFEATLFFAALQRAPASVVGLVFYSYPIWTTVLGFATGLERFRWRLVGSLALGVAGVGLVFSAPATSLSGPVFALGAAVVVAVYFLFVQVLLRDVPASVAAMWTSVGAAIALGVVSLVTGKSLPGEAIGPVIALAAASGFAFLTLYEAITRIGSARSSIAAMLEPVTTIILAALLLNEDLTMRVTIGAALIVSVLPLLATTGHSEPGAPAADTV